MRLTTTRMFAVLFALSLVAMGIGLVFWHGHDPVEDPAHPTGPSSVIRGVRDRDRARMADERRQKALAFERAIDGQDGGASDAASW